MSVHAAKSPEANQKKTARPVVEVVEAFGIRPDPVTGFDRFGVKGHRAHCMACGFLSDITDEETAGVEAREHPAVCEVAL